MQYYVDRTSDWVGEEKPCKKAYKETQPFEIFRGDELVRVDYRDVWCIDINTLEELLELIEEVGRIIINGSSIEIYDTWRE